MTSSAPEKEGVVPESKGGSAATTTTPGSGSSAAASEKTMVPPAPAVAWTGNSISKVKGLSTTEETQAAEVAEEDSDSNNKSSEDGREARGVAPPAPPATIPATLIGAPQEEDVVDSALLSALRDPRERLALLKLEQVLIDFLEKQPDDPYLDVGGPYNTLVVSPSLGSIGDASFLGGGGINTTVTFRPQTTFQRCLLHRLCDRFRMTREKSHVSDGFGYYIRVVRCPDSARPPRLLVDVPPSEYVMELDSAPTNGGNGNFAANFEQMTVTNPAEDGDGNGNSNAPAVPPKPSGSSKPRKMKIMKRSSSSNMSTGSDSKNSSKNSNKQFNSLSEKERKYAEARARIFRHEQSTLAADAGLPPSVDETGQSAAAWKPSGNTSRTASNASSRSSSPSLQREPASSNPSANEQQTSNQGRNKATYRNRQQEEADPDFRRGVAVRVAATPVVAVATTGGWNAGAIPYYPPTAAGQPVAAAAGRGYYPQKVVQQHQQQQHQHAYQQQQLAQQQYYAMPGTHPGTVHNVVYTPGMTIGGVPQAPQQKHVGSSAAAATINNGYPTRVAMATGPGGVASSGRGNPSGAAQYTSARPAVNMSPSDQHFPALR